MRSVIIPLALGLLALPLPAAEQLSLSSRPPDALTGSALAANLASLDLNSREAEVLRQASLGNVPRFLRSLCPVSITNSVAGQDRVVKFFVIPDYFALGSDEDHFRMPVSPGTAQTLADTLGCVLPTRRMVDAIHAAAPLKLSPSPIPPSAAMTAIPVFQLHNEMVQTQRLAEIGAFPLGTLVAGHKKDLVVTPKLVNNPGKVAIYGWHRTNGQPIQPLCLGHTANWVDYSQCTRLVLNKAFLDGRETTIRAILQNPDLCSLLSDEGVIHEPAYSTLPLLPAPRSQLPARPPRF